MLLSSRLFGKSKYISTYIPVLIYTCFPVYTLCTYFFMFPILSLVIQAIVYLKLQAFISISSCVLPSCNWGTSHPPRPEPKRLRGCRVNRPFINVFPFTSKATDECHKKWTPKLLCSKIKWHPNISCDRSILCMFSNISILVYLRNTCIHSKNICATNMGH